MNPRPQPRRGAGRPASERRSGSGEGRAGTEGRRRASLPRPGGDGGQRSLRRNDSELGGEQVEGRQAVRELLVAGRRAVREVWLAEGAERGGPVAEITALAQSRRIPVRQVPRARLDAAAGTEAPQGVLAYAEAVPVFELGDLLGPDGDGVQPFLLVLDGITDPHNVGALLRSAVGAGATGAVIARHRAGRLGPAALKAAAGAVEYLPIALVAGIPAALADLRQAQVWTVGLAAEGSGELWELNVATEAVALVVGAEGHGLSRLARDRCDLLVRIPMSGPLDSLNVAAAGALGCFEVARRRSEAGR
jgi:23S rRNA (guanosine2251-2'-O)-methyltransferase